MEHHSAVSTDLHGITQPRARRTTDNRRTFTGYRALSKSSMNIPRASTECRGQYRNTVEAHGTTHFKANCNQHGKVGPWHYTFQISLQSTRQGPWLSPRQSQLQHLLHTAASRDHPRKHFTGAPTSTPTDTSTDTPTELPGICARKRRRISTGRFTETLLQGPR